MQRLNHFETEFVKLKNLIPAEGASFHGVWGQAQIAHTVLKRIMRGYFQG